MELKFHALCQKLKTIAARKKILMLGKTTSHPRDIMGFCGFIIGFIFGLIFKILWRVIVFAANLIRRDSFNRRIRRAKNKACSAKSNFSKREIARTELYLLATIYSCGPDILKRDKTRSYLLEAVTSAMKSAVEFKDLNPDESRKQLADVEKRLNLLQTVETIKPARTYTVNKTAVLNPKSDSQTTSTSPASRKETKLENWGSQSK